MSETQTELPDTPETAIPSTETVAVCVLCGADGTEAMVPRAVDRLHRLPGEFAFVRCTGCGLARLSPRPLPSEIGFYYPSDYYSYHCVEPEVPDDFGGIQEQEHAEGSERKTPAGADNGRATAPASAGRGGGFLHSIRSNVYNTVLAWADHYPSDELPRAYRALTPLLGPALQKKVFVGRHGFPVGIKPGRALDVGCGSGQFMRLLQYFGWDVAGVEIDPEAVETAHRTTTTEVFAGEVQDAPYEPGSFDFVHMSHVIEHMADPVTSLRAVAALVKPGGSVYIEAPNGDSWNTKPCGAYWFGYDAPRHLHMFSPETLAETVEAAGLVTDRMSTWWFSGMYRWEDTYRQEDERGSLLPAAERPRMRARRWPRALALGARSRAAHVVKPMNADIVGAWAHRPGEVVAR